MLVCFFLDWDVFGGGDDFESAPQFMQGVDPTTAKLFLGLGNR